MNIHDKALNSMFDDMDDMETKKMFPGDKPMTSSSGGMGVTITISPNGNAMDSENPGMESPDDKMDFKDDDHDIALCKGGCAYHKGGMVPGETDDLTLPPFLRKKKV